MTKFYNLLRDNAKKARKKYIKLASKKIPTKREKDDTRSKPSKKPSHKISIH